jgi:ferredoxin
MAFFAGHFSKRNRSKQMSDIQISIIDREGEKHTLSAPTDMALNLMEILRLQEPPFVEGTCGGMALCASCQVYLESDRPDLLEKNEQEVQMLDEAFYVKKNSRLACQIAIQETLHQVCFRLAPL